MSAQMSRMLASVRGLMRSQLAPLPSQLAVLDTRQTAEIQDIAEAQTLIAAVDQLDDFGDTDLVSLIGF